MKQEHLDFTAIIQHVHLKIDVIDCNASMGHSTFLCYMQQEAKRNRMVNVQGYPVVSSATE